MRRWNLRAALIIAVGLGIAPALTVSTAQAATGFGLDGSDPAATGCATGSYPIGGRDLHAGNGQLVAHLEVRYSPKCGTNWVRMYNYTSVGASLKSIQRKSSPSYWETEYDPVSGWSYSMQVYAPGSTCVFVGGALVGKPGSGVGIIAQTPELKFC